MGLKSDVPIFQRVIEYCLKEVADIADPYVDDIIIGTDWQGSEDPPWNSMMLMSGGCSMNSKNTGWWPTEKNVNFL